MHESNLKSIKEGKESGLWNFMDDVDQLIIPTDLSEALTHLDGAYEFFDNIKDSTQAKDSCSGGSNWRKLQKQEATESQKLHTSALSDKSCQGVELSSLSRENQLIDCCDL